MSDEFPKCAACGTQLGHIDMACPNCLPNFYSRAAPYSLTTIQKKDRILSLEAELAALKADLHRTKLECHANALAMLKAAARARGAEKLEAALNRAIHLLNVPERSQDEAWQEGYMDCCEALAKWRAELEPPLKGIENVAIMPLTVYNAVEAELAALRARVQLAESEVKHARGERDAIARQAVDDHMAHLATQKQAEALATALEDAQGCISAVGTEEPEDIETMVLLEQLSGRMAAALQAWRAPASGKREEPT